MTAARGQPRAEAMPVNTARKEREDSALGAEIGRDDLKLKKNMKNKRVWG